MDPGYNPVSFIILSKYRDIIDQARKKRKKKSLIKIKIKVKID